jgi:hypothetical protein
MEPLIGGDMGRYITIRYVPEQKVFKRIQARTVCEEDLRFVIVGGKIYQLIELPENIGFADTSLVELIDST